MSDFNFDNLGSDRKIHVKFKKKFNIHKKQFKSFCILSKSYISYEIISDEIIE